MKSFKKHILKIHLIKEYEDFIVDMDKMKVVYISVIEMNTNEHIVSIKKRWNSVENKVNVNNYYIIYFYISYF